MQLEQYLRAVLASKAAEIDPTQDIWERVKEGITTTEQKGGLYIGQKLKSYLFFWQPAWKKAAAIALCGIFLAGGLTFGVSPRARAWATERIQAIISYKVIRTDVGYAVVKEAVQPVVVNSPDVAGRSKGVKPLITDAQTVDNKTAAEAAAGFPVALPVYLPEGYEQDGGLSADKWNNGKGYVQVLYRKLLAGQQHLVLSLMLTNDQRFFQGGDAVKEVKAGNKTAYWCEYPVINMGAEPTVKAGHILKWADNGVYYMLQDSSSELTLDEMLRIAASIE